MSYRIVILTVRKEKYERVTLDWLYKVNLFIGLGSSPIIYMRKDGDYRPDEVIKLELLDKAKRDLNDNDVAFIVDDCNKAVKMWRDNGYTCLQYNYGDF